MFFKKEKFMDNNFNDNYGMTPSAYNTPNLEVQSEIVLMGTVGAILGALAGAVCILLLQKIGYFASISGVVMAFLSLYLYDKFAGKLSVKGIVICCVVMILMVLLTEWSYYSYLFYNNYKDSFKKVSFWVYFKDLWLLLEMHEGMKGNFLTNLLMLYGFTALGAIPKIKQFATDGTAKVVKADRSGLYKPQSEVVEGEQPQSEGEVKTFDKDFFN